MKFKLTPISLKYMPILPVLAFILAFAIFPLAYAIILSLQNLVLIRPGETTFVGLRNYVYALTEPRFLMALVRTFYYSFLSVTGSFLLGLALALLMHREIKGKSIFKILLIIPMVVTPAVVGYTFKFMMDTSIGIINHIISYCGLPRISFLGDPVLAIHSIALVDIWQGTPLVLLILLAGLESLPKEPFEAALIDGARGLRLHLNITLPLLKPLMLFVVLIRAMDTFRAFDLIYTMTAGGPGTSTEVLGFYIWRMGLSYFRISEAAAMAIIMFLIIQFFSFTFIKTIQKARGGAIA
ncbi:MAG: sugar ABC transporter permease [Desulfurococcaceae archaeon]